MRRFLVVTLSLLIYMALGASPARTGRITLTQPDGSRFSAVFAGDEFMKIKMTESGEAIIQDADGWWCYAVYDAHGRKYSTGCHVGVDALGSGSGQSRNIPYDILSRRALDKRRRAEMSRIYRAESRVSLQAAAESRTDKAGLVILAQFAGTDESFSHTSQEFSAMLTQEGYSSNGATGSAKEYFDEQFGGKYQFSFDVTKVVTLSQKRSYYGGNDANGDDLRPHKMVIEACKLVDSSVDFAKYDQDGDGEVDNVFVFFAGLDEASGASEDHIWSHAWYIKDGAGEDLELDGVVINRYACASELEGDTYPDAYMTAIGTFCHEYSHTLGLPDFYDADYSKGGFAAALWRSTSLMDGGNYNNYGNTPPFFNAIEREILGLSKPVVIDSPGTYQLPPVNQGKYYRINTSTKDEYFLIEYRDGRSWDEYVGGKGVLVYHIDKSANLSGYSYLYEKDIPATYRWASQVEVNSLASHQCADIIEADGREDQFSNYTDLKYVNLQRSLSGIFFPYGKEDYLTPASTPGMKCWGDTEVMLAITDISEKNGQAAFKVISFSGEEMPVPVNVDKEVFQDCAIVSFESSFDYVGAAKVSYGPSGGEKESVTVDSYEPGKWALELSGLEPMTSYSVEVSFVSGGAVGEVVKTSFMTKKRQSDGLPYIYLGSVDRNDDGTFKSGALLPLKVFNAADAKEIRWKYNGVTIKPGKDLHYMIETSGVLEAYVFWEDESTDVIIKNIRISDK